MKHSFIKLTVVGFLFSSAIIHQWSTKGQVFGYLRPGLPESQKSQESQGETKVYPYKPNEPNKSSEINSKGQRQRAMVTNVTLIQQKPELPRGCEVKH
ncbi:hypothetical protein [Paenibacillus eucommiae]|uniref:Uncharacterized protein n=1 Tax=Paenibacillus eucommiae TaxID=1355755 RepID=A0ABS4J2C8_9BACL|nr:hypothetical protein [Paenibacillus eucommiae]MBP1993960.1 hypothetical protein [Paenibacillus eucommiae]